MGKFNRGDRDNRGAGFGGGHRGHGGGFGGRGGGGGRPNFRNDRGPVTMFDAVCSDCGKPCRVPFRPTGDKPVYCNDCFNKRGGGREAGARSDGRNPVRPNDGFSQNDIKTQLAMINIKLDKLLKGKEEISIPKVVSEEAPVAKVSSTKLGTSKKVSKVKKAKK